MIGPGDAEGTSHWDETLTAALLRRGGRHPDLLGLSLFFRYVTSDPDSPSRIG